MKANWIAAGAGLALVLAVLVGRGGAEDAKPPNPEELAKAFTEAGKPGEAHAKLKPLAGSWTYTCKCWMMPGKPAVESQGTIERKWIHGDRFLEERVAGNNFDGTPGFEGFGLFGYDNGTKKYTMTWACTMSTSVNNGVGTSTAPGRFTFHTECYCPVMKKQMKLRDELRIETNDRTVLESYMLEDGKEFKMMEIVATRKK